MIQKMFAVRDSKAQAFLQPFFSVQNGSAIRAFQDACGDEKSPFARHSEDFILYELGTFNDATGEMVSLMPIKMLGCASDFVVRQTTVFDPMLQEKIGSDKADIRGDMKEKELANGAKKVK